MAGAGFKTFNTGDVLLASEVNTYLMQQTVMVFDDATARSSALGANVAEGMFSYLKDTNLTYRYDGSAWLSDAGTTSPLTTKGDLWSYTTTDARLAVGNDGETLVADSSASVGLSYKADFAAGKNKIINGDFTINQRSFTSTTTSGTYGLDRWNLAAVNGTTTYSAETFTPGSAPVAGYEGKNFARIVSSGQSSTDALSALQQRIENVRTFAGQTATVSFWAKAGSGTPSVAVWFQQSFGSGGSTTVIVNGTKQTISTSWARYSFTTNIPSISGKTIGTANDQLILNLTTSAGTDRNSYTDSLGIQSATIDIWGVQIESGSVATAFQTATGTLAGELAACQRYYYRITAGTAYGYLSLTGGANATTSAVVPVNLFSMRVAPTSVEYANAELAEFNGTNKAITSLVIQSTQNNPQIVSLQAGGATGLTVDRPYYLRGANNANGYVGFSAEL